MKNIRFALYLSIVIISLASCATGPKIDSLTDPEANFAHYKTYNFAPKNNDDKVEYTSILGKYLKKAIEQEMQNRGYTLAESPDLLVNFNVSSTDKVDIDEFPVSTVSPYYSYRFGYNPWPNYSYETRVDNYKEGTLNIDLIDAKHKQLVWEGVAVGRLSKKAEENMENTVNVVVPKVFSRYPYIAGQAEPVETKK